MPHFTRQESQLAKCCLLLGLDFEEQSKKAKDKALSSPSETYFDTVQRLAVMYQKVIDCPFPDRPRMMEVVNICWEKEYPLEQVINLLEVF